MPWEIIECSDGAWEVNRLGVRLIVRSFIRATEIKRNARLSVEHQMFGPDMVNVDIDFDKVRAAVDDSDSLIDELFTRVDGGFPMSSILLILRDMRDNTRNAEEGLEALKRSAQKQTSDNIQASVDAGEATVEVLQVVRDLSAEALMVGATMATGGAALAILGAGSLLKGVARFQDTSNFGDAAIETGFNLTFGLVGFGINAGVASGVMEADKSMQAALRFAVAINKGAGEVAKSSLQGRDVFQSLGRGGQTAFIDPAAVTIIGNLLPKGSLWAVPIRAGAKYITQQGIAKATKPAAPSKTASLGFSPQLLADSAVAPDDFVTKTAVRRFAPVSRP
jgi:nucleotide-binding universal stress UspA family protein